MTFKHTASGIQGYKINLIIFCTLLLWCSGFLIYLFFPSSTVLNIAYPFLKQFYSGICHQQPDKCINSENMYYLICYRCSGIYIGGLISSLLPVRIKLKKSLNLFVASFAILIADVFLNTSGIKQYDATIAFITGVCSGFTVILLLLSFLKEQTLLRKEILNAE